VTPGTSPFRGRADRLSAKLEESSLDLLLVTNLVNVRYLCGFTGTNGLCLVGGRERIFLTDFRYVQRARDEAPDYELVQGKRDLLGKVAELVEERGGAGVRLGFDDVHLSVRQHAKLADRLSAGVELVAAGGMVEELRAIKDHSELAAIRSAAAIADALYRWLIEEHGLTGQTELSVARALERRAQDMGAEAVAFPPIVAAAANGALPHAVPRDVAIPGDTLVVVDLGCRVDGYCSDCTRTLATGSVDGEAREVYELVQSAQSAARAAVREGIEAAAVDAAAREKIARAGRAEEFGHPTGHGVGLEVHEDPRLSPDAGGALAAGNVVTIEPGIYVPERLGVRIEDLVVVRPDGCEVLTLVPRDLITAG
jgi:Xaa-Pro aminopeptidase